MRAQRGLGCQIGLRRERFTNADGQIFLTHDIGIAAGDFLIANGRQPEGFRPLGEFTGRGAGANQILKRITRIAADGDRNTEPRLFGNLLNLLFSSAITAGSSADSRVIRLFTLAPEIIFSAAAIS